MEKTAEQIFKELSAPFTATSPEGKEYFTHKWKPQGVVGGKFLCVPYIDTRQASKRMNDVLGIDGWSDNIEEISGKGKISVVTAIICGKEVCHSDIGVGGGIETEKSEVSDSKKRAFVHFGVGAYLYETEPVSVNMMVVNGKKVPCSDGDKPVALVGDALSSYINLKHPLKSKLYEIYNSLTKEERKELKTEFEMIAKKMV